MSRSNDAGPRAARAPGAPRHRLTPSRAPAGLAFTPVVALAAAVAGVLGAGRAAAQVPAPSTPDTARARRDSTRADRDSLRARAARADSAFRAAPSDSSRRDSVIARQLTRESRTGTPVYHRYAPDRLRLTALGVSGGVAAPDQVKATTIYGVHADYGELGPALRAVFGLTYWSSHVGDRALADLARAVRATVPDSAAAAGVRVGPVRVSDVALHADLRWRPPAFRRVRLPLGLRPWVSAGAGVHLLDVQGAPITGTFVERSLDGVSIAVAGALGVDATLLPNVQLSAQARYDLFNGAHYPSARVGAVYVLDRRVRP